MTLISGLDGDMFGAPALFLISPKGIRNCGAGQVLRQDGTTVEPTGKTRLSLCRRTDPLGKGQSLQNGRNDSTLAPCRSFSSCAFQHRRLPTPFSTRQQCCSRLSQPPPTRGRGDGDDGCLACRVKSVIAPTQPPASATLTKTIHDRHARLPPTRHAAWADPMATTHHVRSSGGAGCG